MGALNNPLLWGGLGALGIAVPIVIHLLYRKHRRQTDWAAMELLRRALVIRSGQVKLEDYLILFLRCLALALLALALLRPTTNSDSSGIIGEKKVGMIVAIDASYSMNHGDHSRFQRAVEKAHEIFKTANEGDPVSVVLMSSKPEVLLRGAAYVPGQIKDLLDGLESAGPNRLSLETNIELLDELVGEMKTPGKECFLITDSQELDWANLPKHALASLENLTDNANVFVIPAGNEGEDNLAIESFNYTWGTLRESGEARFTASVRNTGRNAADGGTLEFFVDDALSKRISVGTIEPGKTRPVDFTTQFASAGEVKLRAELSNDDLDDDNVRHAVARIRAGIQVLLLDGDPTNTQGARSGAYYAKIALRPQESDTVEGVVINELDPADIGLESLREYDVVILNNVLSLSSDTASRLRRFVTNGGGLIIFSGDRLEASAYNQTLGGENGILPAVLGELAECPDTAGWTVQAAKSDHLLAGLTNRYPEKLLDVIRVNKLIKATPAQEGEILITTQSGDPLLLSRKVGSGSVLLFTTSGNKSWNNLPREPLYTILLQQAVTMMTSDPDGLQLTVGTDVNLAVTGREVGEFVSLIDPQGDTADIRVTQDEDRTVAAVELKDLGVYEIKGEGDNPPVVVAANVDAKESDVRVVDGSALAGTLDGTGVEVLNREGSMGDAIRDARRGRELAHILLWLAVIVFVAQSVLARHFTNKMEREDAPDLSATLQMSQVAAARRS